MPNFEEYQPNDYLISTVISAIKAASVADTIGLDTSTAYPRTKLDSHANMVVLERNAYVFERTGRTCNVKPFSKELGMQQDVPIVDGAIAYECPYTFTTFILIVRNALHIPSMESNLIPPFIMRAGGVTVNDTAKIHCENPTKDDHCIIFGEGDDLRIPLQLFGIFSYFHSRAPTEDELFECDKYFITPDASDWNPHCVSFEQNERAMTTFNGEMADASRRVNNPMMYHSEGDNALEIAQVTIDDWDAEVDHNIMNSFNVQLENENSTNESEEFASILSLRGEISKMQSSLGSTNISSTVGERNLFDDEPIMMDFDELEHTLAAMMDPQELEEMYANIAAINADKAVGVLPEFLSKLWCIPENLAKEATEQNTQLCCHNADNHLFRQLSTNDRMLRYRRIQSTFFSDTMFALKHKSTRGNVCCQIFVSDRGYVAVYPMKSQSEFPTTLHWFCKQVGVPDALVTDGHKSLKSNEVRRFCDQVGTTLRTL